MPLKGYEDYIDELENDDNSDTYQRVSYDGPAIDPEELF
jgi:hypothetical protein